MRAVIISLPPVFYAVRLVDRVAFVALQFFIFLKMFFLFFCEEKTDGKSREVFEIEMREIWIFF